MRYIVDLIYFFIYIHINENVKVFKLFSLLMIMCVQFNDIDNHEY